MSPGPVVHFHIFRTGGTTVRRILMRQYGESNVARIRLGDEAAISDHEAVTGHFGPPDIPDEIVPHYSFSFLRDPVDRCVSYLARQRESGDSESITEVQFPELYNLQVRMLAGVTEDVPLGRETQTHLDAAIAAAESMNFVGLTEQFDASILAVARDLSWSPPYYAMENRGNYRSEVTDAERDQIRNWNELDIQLYQVAASRLESELESRKIDASVLGVFQRKNRLYAAGTRLLRPVVRAVKRTRS